MAEVTKGKKPIQRKASAMKRTRQSRKRAVRNSAHYSRVKNRIKLFREALTTRNKEEAKKLLVPTLSLIAKMVSKGILHRNTAASYQSRLQRQFNAL